MNFTWPNASASEKRLFEAIRILVGDDPRLLEYLFDPIRPRLRRRAGILKEDAWNFSDGEQLLIRAALDFWSGSGHLPLWEMVENWESTNWIHFINAIIALKGLSGHATVAPSVRSAGRGKNP